MSEAATANWMKRSVFLTSFFSSQRSGSKPLTSAAIRAACNEASKSVIGPTPDWPARRLFHVLSTSLPTGDTIPSPVTTTLRLSGKLLLRTVLLDVIDGFLHLRDLLGVLVGDLDPELLLEGHHELHRVQAVGAQVVHERRLGGDELLLDAELVDDDLLDAIRNRLHQAPPGSRWLPLTLVGPTSVGNSTCGSRRPPPALAR